MAKTSLLLSFLFLMHTNMPPSIMTITGIPRPVAITTITSSDTTSLGAMPYPTLALLKQKDNSSREIIPCDKHVNHYYAVKCIGCHHVYNGNNESLRMYGWMK